MRLFLFRICWAEFLNRIAVLLSKFKYEAFICLIKVRLATFSSSLTLIKFRMNFRCIRIRNYTFRPPHIYCSVLCSEKALPIFNILQFSPLQVFNFGFDFMVCRFSFRFLFSFKISKEFKTHGIDLKYLQYFFEKASNLAFV